MKTFEFRTYLAGIDRSDDMVVEALFEASCDDGTLFTSGGEVGIGFSREASTLEEAVRSAIASVAQVGYSVGRVEPAEAAVFERINQELAVH